MPNATRSAPSWQIEHWLNAPPGLTLESLRGRVILLHAFQMLCPACVAHGLPQADRVRDIFPGVAVVALHTVFEHHEVMNIDALRAFAHEYRLRMPIGVDLRTPGSPIPRTMAAYGMRGTPSLVLIDQHGLIRLEHFGRLDDLALGAAIGRLLAEGMRQPDDSAPVLAAPSAGDGPCSAEACGVSRGRAAAGVAPA